MINSRDYFLLPSTIAEEVVSNQIMQSCSNVLELMRKEKDYEEHQLFCVNDDDPISRDAFQSLQDDILRIAKDERIRDGIARVRRVIDDAVRDEHECAVA